MRTLILLLATAAIAAAETRAYTAVTLSLPPVMTAFGPPAWRPYALVVIEETAPATATATHYEIRMSVTARPGTTVANPQQVQIVRRETWTRPDGSAVPTAAVFYLSDPANIADVKTVVQPLTFTGPEVIAPERN